MKHSSKISRTEENKIPAVVIKAKHRPAFKVETENKRKIYDHLDQLSIQMEARALTDDQNKPGLQMGGNQMKKKKINK
jgi:translation initiation factor IF-1